MRQLFLLMTGVVLILAGCGRDQTTEPDPAPAADTEIPTDLAQMLHENTPEQAQMVPNDDESDPGWPDAEYVAHSDIYAVTFVWGNLTGVTPAFVPTDWDGTLSVNGVAQVLPRQTLDFEPDEDWIVDENLPHAAQWVSHTDIDIDGISFLVFLRNDVTYIAAPQLTFETEPFAISYGFGELDKLFAFYPMDNGNFVAVIGRRLWPQDCPGGFFDGTWIKADNSGMNGTLNGVWYDYNGEPIGNLSGQFSTSEDGHRELSGSVSGYYTDQVIAEFKGTWWYDDLRLCPLPECGTGHGWFRAHFAYADGSHRGGVLSGEIGDYAIPVVTGQELPIRGFWRNLCGFDWTGITPDSDPGDRF